MQSKIFSSSFILQARHKRCMRFRSHRSRVEDRASPPSSVTDRSNVIREVAWPLRKLPTSSNFVGLQEFRER